MAPAEHLQRLPLERMAMPDDGHPLRIALEVVEMGSVSSGLSTR
jgi:hypothetical protein